MLFTYEVKQNTLLKKVRKLSKIIVRYLSSQRLKATIQYMYFFVEFCLSKQKNLRFLKKQRLKRSWLELMRIFYINSMIFCVKYRPQKAGKAFLLQATVEQALHRKPFLRFRKTFPTREKLFRTRRSATKFQARRPL